ncbi:50S ribosomal protein L19e [Candidatus Woesearchaeota archaeon]|nr:50S ribosomal protein L19e [Candidatus Woesearchaeota archaeon]
MKNKKRLAAKLLKTSYTKIKFSPEALDEIKKAITRSDMRGLIAVHKITESQTPFHSRAGARRNAAQKRKGRQRGKGSKEGSKFSTVNKKERWMARIRVQRSFLKELKEKALISIGNYRMLYAKTKGGYFRNKRHIKLYLTEHNLFEAKKQ